MTATNRWGFNADEVVTRSRDGHNVVVVGIFVNNEVKLEPLTFTRRDGVIIEYPLGMVKSDGASTPPPLWPLLPPFGVYWMAAIGHDGLYQGTAVIIINGIRSEMMASKPFCDDTFKEMMEFLGTDEDTAFKMYQGVHLMGWHSFNEDRAIQEAGAQNPQ